MLMADTTTETTDRCAVACSCVATTSVEELQAPVAELRGYLEALARSDGTADLRLVAAARAAGDRVRDVTDALAAYADTDRVADRRRIQYGPVVSAAAEVIAEELADRDLALDVGLLPTLTADPRQLYRATLALLQLAVDTAVPGSTLTVRALRHSSEWQLRVAVQPPITPARPASDVSHASGGVQLLTAQRVAEAHGGNLWLIDGDDGPPAVWLTIPDQAGSGPRQEAQSPWSR